MSVDTPSPDQVRNNTGEGRFELVLDEGVAFLNYRVLTRGELGLIHTEVPEELSGQGVGSALVEGTLRVAREKGWTVLPYCPFVHGWMKRHDDYADLISYRYPKRDELLPEPEPEEEGEEVEAGEDAAADGSPDGPATGESTAGAGRTDGTSA